MMTNNYKPFIGGVPISIERLAEKLRKLGHEVYVFAPSYDAEVEEEYVIRYHSLKRKLRKEFIIPNILDPMIEEKFRELSFDLIHVHHPMLIGYIAEYLGRKYNIPVVLTYHTRYEQYLHYLKPFERKKGCRQSSPGNETAGNRLLISSGERLLAVHNRRIINRCSMVFAPSPSMKQYLMEQGVLTDIEVIPTGILEEEFEFNQERAASIRKQFGGNSAHVFCTVSRLEKEKNIEFLLEGLKAYQDRRGDDFRFLVIGEGGRRQLLAERARSLGLEENIIFCGNIPHTELSDYYHACDVFLFASTSETQGIVLLEAMAAGLPVVAVKASGVQDVIIDGRNGFMTKPEISPWADRLIQVVENKELREQMQKRALEEAKGYLASNIAKKVQQHYQNILYNRRLEQEYEYQNIYPITSRIISYLSENNLKNR
ncbi:MAG TPA: glycosyltransferase family 4 protein [Clostridiales bacterium]|nr:glycosyltransferase family 4 protein [Clostridiales bacterium]